MQLALGNFKAMVASARAMYMNLIFLRIEESLRSKYVNVED